MLGLMYVQLFQIITQPVFGCQHIYLTSMALFSMQKSENIIDHPSNTANHIYLLLDPVHLLKNIRNNLFNSERFIFPSFKFDNFFDPSDVPGGEISWKLLHEDYDKDEKLPANMNKASKVSYKAMHPGDNK